MRCARPDSSRPGRLFRTAYRLLLKPEYAATFEKDLNAAWEEAGLRYRAPEDAVDGLRLLLDMLNTFMSVIGIAALVAGGVGVAQATSSFLESRIDSIAALKALGADAGTIRAAYATQLGVLAGLGALVGRGAGRGFALAAARLITGDAIPLPTNSGALSLAAPEGVRARHAGGRDVRGPAAGPGAGDAAGRAVPARGRRGDGQVALARARHCRRRRRSRW